MSRRLPSYWARWQRTNTRRLIREGLPRELAARFSKTEAAARANAGFQYGKPAAERAIFELTFNADGTMAGRLIGVDPNAPQEKENTSRFRAVFPPCPVRDNNHMSSV